MIPNSATQTLPAAPQGPMNQQQAIAAAKKLLNGKKHILIAVPADVRKDLYAAATGLMLALKDQSREVTVVSPKLPNVEQSDLFGIDRITDTIPPAAPLIVVDRAVGNIERVSWEVKNEKLHLLLHLHKGVKEIDPATIHITKQQQAVDLVVLLGTSTLDGLGALATQDEQLLTTPTIIINTQEGPGADGKVSIIDPNVPSISGVVAAFLRGMSESAIPADAAKNLLTGLRDGTQDFRDARITPEVFELAAFLARASRGAMEAAVASPPRRAQPRQAPRPPADQTPPPSDQDVPAAPPDADWLEPKIYRGTSLS